MSNPRFFLCEHCGNRVGMLHDGCAPMLCCGQPMTELIPGSRDAAQEKHVPSVRVQDDTVTVSVGSTPHPMVEEHFIEWVYLHTAHGGQRKALTPGQKPETAFSLCGGDRPLAVYAYCNLHGLWKTDL